MIIQSIHFSIILKKGQPSAYLIEFIELASIDEVEDLAAVIAEPLVGDIIWEFDQLFTVCGIG